MGTLVPLSFVIILAILKDFIAEIIRWKEDRRFNGSICNRMLPITDEKLRFEQVRQDEIKVGDILEIKDNELIPADCVLLHTTN